MEVELILFLDFFQIIALTITNVLPHKCHLNLEEGMFVWPMQRPWRRRSNRLRLNGSEENEREGWSATLQSSPPWHNQIFLWTSSKFQLQGRHCRIKTPTPAEGALFSSQHFDAAHIGCVVNAVRLDELSWLHWLWHFGLIFYTSFTVFWFDQLDWLFEHFIWCFFCCLPRFAAEGVRHEQLDDVGVVAAQHAQPGAAHRQRQRQVEIVLPG